MTTPQLMPVLRPPDEEHHTSEFAVPEGLELPSVEQSQQGSEFSLPKGMNPSEQAQQTSGFIVPEGLTTAPPTEPRSEFRYNADWASTPANGIRSPLLAKGLPWHDRMRTMVRLPLSERPAPEPQAAPEGDEETPPLPVPRVLDLTLRIGELLLASGEGAEDVETAMFAIAHAYGLDRCEATVTFTLIGITHQPSLVDAPVSLSRTVRRRGTDYNRLAAVFRLVDDINSGTITLEEAYGRLATIRRNRHPYSKMQLSLAAGLLAGAASTLVGGGVLVFVLAVSGAILGDRMAWVLASRGLPEFYQFVAAAMAPAAIGVSLAAVHPGQQGLIQAAAVITGGLFALIPGRALVASVQDGLTGYYITAAARMLEVFFLIAGIVLGVLSVLYIGEVSGVSLDPETVEAKIRPAVQLAAAMLLALAFCVMLQQDKSTVVIATLNGGVAWLIVASMRDTADLSPFAATLVAAGLVGLFGQLLARYRLTSSLPYVTAAIGPLLPGGATYFGLLGLAQGDIATGGQQLLRAASIALAIAIGVNLGNEIARLFIGTPGMVTPFGRRGAKRTRGF
ncbi:threonine/serine ThrE exporter family protein [Streptomyces spiramenti]|uniref:Threonine/serine exporter family protein n=1 Tax=Streptomyces spiramenti TaxID=2720606 RepID=A0ABX1AK26_9ACTN|nr:threonine/serine exporter family protein [Streptomyces spiramenti]NJP66021.1 threonine/serine exporter family protein [Streptomyces spiramenti]